MKKNSTKIIAATLALIMTAAMTACGSSNSSSSTPPTAPTPPPSSSQPSSESTPSANATPEELAKKYTDAITAARDEELNQAYNIITNISKDATIEGYLAEAKENKFELTPEKAEENYNANLEMTAAALGLNLADAEAYAISTSMMNVKAYGIVIVKPVEGKGADMETAMKGYVEAQKKAFESYLVDQKEVADAAMIKTLDDGTVIMVMSENQDAIYDAIVAELAK